MGLLATFTNKKINETPLTDRPADEDRWWERKPASHLKP